MTKIGITKSVAHFIVGAGVTRIVNSIIVNNVPTQTVVDKITTTAGALALGGIAADASKEYTSAKIDEIAEWWNDRPKNAKTV